MRLKGLATALVLVALMASTSGCMGLIAARESVESLREEPFESLKNQKIEVSHEFVQLLPLNEFTNISTFVVDDQTAEIRIYFRARISFSDTIPSDNTTRYVRAVLTDSAGNVQWEQDVSETATPLEQQLLPTPEFVLGEWDLNVKARGIGETTVGFISDDFDIIVTVTNTCIQYPLVDDCF
jgi:hypothetical protein